MRLARRWRWIVVAAATAVLVSLPLLARLLPGGDSTISARDLLARIKASADVPFAGYAQSTGGLTLPVSNGAFSDLGDLLGGQSRLRVWWRAPDDWRVDSIGATGESDLRRDAEGFWTWDYEAGSARRTSGVATPSVRLPRTDDVLAPTLARRLLSEADPADVTRLDGERVAGFETAGLRLRVRDSRSTIDHVDVWALPASGLPVRVEVSGASGRPVLATRFLDLDTARPARTTTRFRPAPGTGVEFGRQGGGGDIVSFVDRFGRSRPPANVAGLPRRTDLDLGAVGVYGRGVTTLVAVPLTARLAGEVVPEARRTPGAVEDERGIAVSAGAVNLQLSAPTGYGARWLLVGTVTPDALTQAVPGLPPVRDGFGFGGPDR